ncbi:MULTISPECIES: WcaF family extracellular polysaccharide biosynthesis acetyltransferase [unclassified Streptomyces]|uniref:WcaF family extracellular polysaccharide biosynthesis acetyltransferase n=1 Tax=unclassified Streptomyces TaxID=2593676 RepID=UPI0013BEC760|nr:WcaF family extracellular polysaccharide biosynthesis acetyltransferase [Streptomyces sp. SID10853]NDZ78079.1 colanic acid biosynthesis acetyltransferase WcaF [Streptomyces sp. SID10853]WSU40471.1 WcaF family extracellular polysaccharide biosynthesis acetyltransferase [Streptomyces sp. NBC_01089]
MRNLPAFTLAGYDKGRGRLTQALWFAVLNTVFMAWFCPARLRVALLRAFGATIGEGVLIRHRVRVLWPWKLTVGDHTWIGEGAWLLNLEPVTLGAHVCVSQEALLCTGSHDHRAADFRYRNAPIVVRDGAWIATRATVLAGVTIGAQSVVAAGTVVHRDLPDLTLHTAAGRRPVEEPV